MIITKDKAMIPENEWDEGYIKGYADSARDSYYTWEKNQHRWHDATQEKPTEVCEVYIYILVPLVTRGNCIRLNIAMVLEFIYRKMILGIFRELQHKM